MTPKAFVIQSLLVQIEMMRELQAYITSQRRIVERATCTL